jgi:hypothetical protein
LYQYLLLEEGQTPPWVPVDEKNDCRPLPRQWRADNNINQVQALSNFIQKSESPISCIRLLTSVTTSFVSFAFFSIKNRAVIIIMVYKCCVPMCNGKAKKWFQSECVSVLKNRRNWTKITPTLSSSRFSTNSTVKGIYRY